MTEQEAENRINAIPRFTEKHDLNALCAYLDALGAPDLSGSRVIHVAGTNGKGSTCCYLSHCLNEAGFSVGTFLSPHLVTMRERMLYNGEMISEDDFVRMYEKVEETRKRTGLPEPTFFEMLFLMAECWFAEKKPDYLVLETGLGGRLDATNAVRKKDLCVITRIGMDHMQILGDTIEKIAGEKAGILKKGVPAVALPEPQEAHAVIEKRAKECGAPLVTVDAAGVLAAALPSGNIDFSMEISYDKRGQSTGRIHAVLKTPALYQAENASLAVTALAVLRDRGEKLPDAAVEKGLSGMSFAGRMEEIRKNFYIDGAHNEDGMRAFLESAVPLSRGKHTMLLYAAMQDKAWEKELSMIAESRAADWIVLIGLQSPRGEDPEKLRDALAGKVSCPVTVLSRQEGTKEALRIAERYQEKYPNSLVLACGSLYLAGEIKEVVSHD